jgi:hypothetical protein
VGTGDVFPQRRASRRRVANNEILLGDNAALKLLGLADSLAWPLDHSCC